MASIDFLLLTDTSGSDSQRALIDAVVSRVSQQDIGWLSYETKVLSPEDIGIITEVSKDYVDRQMFLSQFERIRGSFDVAKLLCYAEKTDVELYRQVAAGREIGEALWEAYQRSLKGNWDNDLNYAVVKDEASKQGFPNVIEVLFDKYVVAADFGVPGNIPYHMLGRGLVAEGGRWPVTDNDNNDTGRKLILLPLTLYGGEDAKQACAFELINHELVGHAIMGLVDHACTDVDPAKCVMSVPDERAEFVKLASSYRGPLFCDACTAYAKSIGR